MSGPGKLTVVLSWDEKYYRCQFKRGRKKTNWNDLTRDEQIRVIGSMVTTAKSFENFIKDSE